ncbi:MAG: hypothetical protein HS107_14560 [Thermoflexaceae bacterium]|nr:hypothetical protein [Thermoflexaceae bacterium]
MPDLTARAPIETEKTGWLHDRSRIPARPAASAQELLVRYRGWLLGFALALGLTALAFQTRASWENHRDWVVPMTVTIWAPSGLALGFLIDRRRWKAVAPGIVLLVIALVLTGVNIWRGTETDGQDNWRDALSIITGVTIGFMAVALLAALAWSEMKGGARNGERPAE